MSNTNYKPLYSLQTEVLHQLNTIKGPFYLTGGTALGRFYIHHRLSADLDFFVNKHTDFKKAVEPYENILKEHFLIQKEGSLVTDEFVRFLIVHNHVSLKIDFVNDVLYRYKTPLQNNIHQVDNVRNILSNKLTCIVGRDEPKDFFDIICLATNYQFNWLELFNEASEKALINEIDISQRISEFPVEWLLQVDWLMQPPDIERIQILQEIISKDILLGDENSLCLTGIRIDDAVIDFK